VPQFIDVEDKILGPFTFKQVIYLGGGIGGAFLIYSFVKPFLLAIVLIIPVGLLVTLLAFYKINNKAFIFFIQSFLNYLAGDKLYIWKKKPKKVLEEGKKIIDASKNTNDVTDIQKVTSDKLRDLSWRLDVREEKKN